MDDQVGRALPPIVPQTTLLGKLVAKKGVMEGVKLAAGMGVPMLPLIAPLTQQLVRLFAKKMGVLTSRAADGTAESDGSSGATCSRRSP